MTEIASCPMTHAEHEAARLERANDHALIELARNYKPSPETLREMAKYRPFVPTFEKMFMVLP